MKDYRKLFVWQKAHELTLMIYKESNAFPTEEKYGLTSQIRRSVISIPTNIAEGCGRFSQKDFAHFLQIAFGSAQEVDHLNFLASELGFLKHEMRATIHRLISEVKAMLIGLIKKVKSN